MASSPSKSIIWKPETAKVSDLKLWRENPRTISEQEYTKLKESIVNRGFHDIIKVDTNLTILSGNMRKRALEELGMESVTVMVPSRKLTKREKELISLESNRHRGEWDWDALKEFDKDLLQLVGFEDKDLAKYFPNEIVEDEAPEPRPDPNVKLGDLFQLGNHRLLCGDATKKADVERLMDGQKADMVFTSPPYNANAKTGDGDIFNGKDSKEMYQGEYKDDMSLGDYVKLSKDSLELCFANTNGFIFWNVSYNANSRFAYIRQIEDRLEYLIEQICWKKSSAIPIKGSMRRAWEPVYVFSTSKTSLGTDTVETNVWEISNTNSQTDTHKACFPVALPAKGIGLVKNSKTVYDPFGGSGSTLIACEQLNRKCYMMEIDPQYVRVIIARWEKLTGKKSVKLA